MDSFLRPSGTDDRIGELNVRLRNDESLEPFRQRVLQNVESIADPEQRQFAIGENMLINEDRIGALSESYGVDLPKVRDHIADWYDFFADEYEADPENTPNPIERTNRWMQAKLKSAASEQEAESIKTGGMADVGRFIGEVASLPAEVPLRLGFDIADAVTGNNQPSALFGTNPTTDPIENYQTDNQLVAGVANIEPDKRAKFFDSFDPETGEIVPAEPFRAASGVVGMGAREVTKALALGMGLGATGATSAIGGRAAALAGGTGKGAVFAREVAESVPLFVALGAAGRGEAGEGLGSVGDVASDVATGALFGAVSGAVQTLGRSATTKWLKKNDPKLADMLKAAEESGGQMTPRLRESLSKLGTLEDLDAATQKALTAAQTIDKNIGIAEVGTQFLAGYLVDRAQGVSHEEAAVNGILFSVLDVARARGMNVSRAEIEPVRRLAVAAEVAGSKPGKVSLSKMDNTEFVQSMPESDFVEGVKSGEIPEHMTKNVDVRLPAEEALARYDGAHKYPFEYEPVPNGGRPEKPLAHYIQETVREFGSITRRNKNIPRGTLGRMFFKMGRTEILERNDASTAFHEVIGHHLDNVHQIVTEDWAMSDPRIAEELGQFFEPKGDDIRTTLAESFGAFVQSYMQAPEATAAAAPLTLARMQERVGKKTMDAINRRSQEYRRYLSLDPVERTRAQFVEMPNKYPSAVEQLANAIKDLGYEGGEVLRYNALESLKHRYIDEVAPIEKAVILAQEMRTGKKTENVIDLIDRNPAMQWARILNGGLGEMSQAWVELGIPKFTGDIANEVYAGTEGGFEKRVFGDNGLNDRVERELAEVLMVSRRIVQRVADDVADARDAFAKDRDALVEPAREKYTKLTEELQAIEAQIAEGRKRGESENEFNERRIKMRKTRRRIRDRWKAAQSDLRDAEFEAGIIRQMLDKEIARIENADYTGAALPRGVTDTAGLKRQSDYRTAEEAIARLEADNPERFGRMMAASDAATAYMDAMMRALVDLGWMSRTDLDRIRERNSHYVTLERLVTEDATPSSKLLKFVGSKQPIVAPSDAMMGKMQRLLREALINKQRQEFVNSIESDPMWQSGNKDGFLNTIIQPIGEATTGIDGFGGAGAKLAGATRRRDRARATIDELTVRLQSGRKAGEKMKAFEERTRQMMRRLNKARKEEAKAIGEIERLPTGDEADRGQILKVRGIGKDANGRERSVVRHYYVPERLLWESLNSIGKHGSIPMAVKAIGLLGQTMKHFVTHGPGFLVRNPTRGAMVRSIIGAPGSRPWDSLPGTRFTTEEVRNQVRQSGAGGAGVIGEYRSLYDTDMLRAKKKAAASGPMSIFAPFGDMYRGWMNLAEKVEFNERAPEWVRTYEAELENGATPHQAAMYATMRYRGLTDFAKIGAQFRSINYLFPFSNAAIQSSIATIRNFRRNPRRAALAWGLGAVLPSLLTYEFARMMGDEEEYLELPAYQRDFFWNFKVGDNMWFRVPKPFEFGVLASGIERMYASAVHGAEDQSEGFANSLINATSPFDGGAFMGPLRPYIELALNQDTFRDRPIIPTWEADLDVRLREGTDRASRLGKMLQSVSGMDSRKWDHYLKAQFAEFGQYATRLSDIMREDRPFDWRDFVTVRGPVSNAKSVRMVLDAAERYGETNNKLVRRLKGLLSMYHEMETRGEQDEIGKTIREYANSMLPFIDMWKQNIRPMP